MSEPVMPTMTGSGLTKRELFAALLYAASPLYAGSDVQAAEKAVERADILLRILKRR